MPTWTLRVYSQNPVTLKKDSMGEAKLTEMKAAYSIGSRETDRWARGMVGFSSAGLLTGQEIRRRLLEGSSIGSGSISQSSASLTPLQTPLRVSSVQGIPLPLPLVPGQSFSQTQSLPAWAGIPNPPKNTTRTMAAEHWLMAYTTLKSRREELLLKDRSRRVRSEH
jgi:hypothetical protein